MPKLEFAQVKAVSSLTNRRFELRKIISFSRVDQKLGPLWEATSIKNADRPPTQKQKQKRRRYSAATVYARSTCDHQLSWKASCRLQISVSNVNTIPSEENEDSCKRCHVPPKQDYDKCVSLLLERSQGKIWASKTFYLVLEQQAATIPPQINQFVASVPRYQPPTLFQLMLLPPMAVNSSWQQLLEVSVSLVSQLLFFSWDHQYWGAVVALLKLACVHNSRLFSYSAYCLTSMFMLTSAATPPANLFSEHCRLANHEHISSPFTVVYGDLLSAVLRTASK